MMMTLLKKTFQFLTVLLLLASCSNNKQYTISKNRVGYLNSTTTVQELDDIFKKDSLVKRLSEGVLGYRGTYSQDDDKYLVYENNGKLKLIITPKEPLDSLSTISYIDVIDPKYTTEKGIGLSSTFEEINLQTHIAKIETTFSKATLFLDEINSTMTLDKREIGVKGMSSAPILIEQIPNLVKPKTFVVWFE